MRPRARFTVSECRAFAVSARADFEALDRECRETDAGQGHGELLAAAREILPTLANTMRRTGWLLAITVRSRSTCPRVGRFAVRLYLARLGKLASLAAELWTARPDLSRRGAGMTPGLLSHRDVTAGDVSPRGPSFRRGRPQVVTVPRGTGRIGRPQVVT